MRKIAALLSLVLVAACATTTEEGAVGVKRRQWFAVSDEQIVQMSAQSYEQTKQEAAKKGVLDKSPVEVQRVQTIMRRLIPSTAIFRKDAPGWAWESHVVTSDELNAYCMPGGKIIFYTGIIQKLKLTDAEIAAIMGHEIAHALREHGRERMSEQLVQQVGLQILVATGKLDPKYAGALAAVTNIVVNLRHSREQELEGDTIGVELMARAGYDPREAVTLWRKMSSNGGAKPPAMLSTHPTDESRIENIESLIPKVLPLYQAVLK